MSREKIMFKHKFDNYFITKDSEINFDTNESDKTKSQQISCADSWMTLVPELAQYFCQRMLAICWILPFTFQRNQIPCEQCVVYKFKCVMSTTHAGLTSAHWWAQGLGCPQTCERLSQRKTGQDWTLLLNLKEVRKQVWLFPVQDVIYQGAET